MEDLIQKVSEKTGISPEQAKDAVTTVIDHLKDKLPWGLGEKIESFISGSGAPTEEGAAPEGSEGIFDELKNKLSGGITGLF